MQSIQKTCDLHEKMAATGMFHFFFLEDGGGGFTVEESFECFASTLWLPGGTFLVQTKSGSPSYLPLFTLLVKSTLLIVAGGAKNAEALVTKFVFLFF